MTQRLHLVFGGELVDTQKNAFQNVEGSWSWSAQSAIPES